MALMQAGSIGQMRRNEEFRCYLYDADSRRALRDSVVTGCIWLPIVPRVGDWIETNDPQKKGLGDRFQVLGVRFVAHDYQGEKEPATTDEIDEQVEVLRTGISLRQQRVAHR